MFANFDKSFENVPNKIILVLILNNYIYIVENRSRIFFTVLYRYKASDIPQEMFV